MIFAKGRALSIIHCKRGDVVETMEKYAEVRLGPRSGFGGDAMTVIAYLAFDRCAPFLTGPPNAMRPRC